MPYTRNAEAWKSHGFSSLMQGKQPPPGYKTYFDRVQKRWVLIGPSGQKHVCEAHESRLDVLELAYNHWRMTQEQQGDTDDTEENAD